MKSFFDNFPREVLESAMVDGCSRTGALFRIVLPIGAPGIASAAIITFLWTWNEFIYAFVFTSTPNAQPVTVGSFDAIGDIFVNWNQMCAGALIAALPGILFVFVAQKYQIRAHQRRGKGVAQSPIVTPIVSRGQRSAISDQQEQQPRPGWPLVPSDPLISDL